MGFDVWACQEIGGNIEWGRRLNGERVVIVWIGQSGEPLKILEDLKVCILGDVRMKEQYGSGFVENF